MEIIWAFGQLVYAFLAFVGFFVVLAVAWVEGMPRFRLWVADVRHGYGHYRAVRAELRVREESAGAVARAQQLIELAKERMAAALQSDLDSRP